MRPSLRPALFHSVLVALVSLCNYFIKMNEAVADVCNWSQLQICSKQCGSYLTTGSCFYSSGTGVVSCDCRCRSGDEYDGQWACNYATANKWRCNNGNSYVYCFSFDRSREVCDGSYGGNVKCRRYYYFDMTATSSACECRYSSSHGGDNVECYNRYNYGTLCQYNCPSYSSVYGTRNTLVPGGRITDCSVYVSAACDSTGCFDSHTCPYTN